MTFAAQMANDWAMFTDPVAGFGDYASFVPSDGGGASFPITVTEGDVTPSVSQFGGGQEGSRVAPFFSQKSVIVAGILATTGKTRDCHRGDQFVIAAPSSNAGTWTIDGPPSQDAGDGIQVQATLATLDAPGAQSAREIR